MHSLREFLNGPPLPTHHLEHVRLNKFRALAAFAPDGLSSIAYANQEIYLGLSIAGAAGLAYAWPIVLAIAALMAIVGLSYMQTIPAYPHGGGSYTVARENLGKLPGLVAGSSLLIAYVLTAAVSLTAGVAAIASAFPVLWGDRVMIALLILVVITFTNLRGMLEASGLMAAPVYLFIFCYIVMIGIGLVRAVVEGPGNLAVAAPLAQVPVSFFLILHTFASGSTALTGIEVISNGVPAFKPPQVKNARATLFVLVLLMGGLFMGTIFLTHYFAVIPASQETILSALAVRILGRGLPYILVQVSTLLVLAVAANSSFTGFPRLASALALDRYLPGEFAHLGDRLVYSSGIVLLAVLTGVLIVVFNGDSHALIPLFAVGVFLAFTLSQAGMVVHWLKQHHPGWIMSALINGTGAVVTFFAVVIIAYSKFLEGAWFVIFLIPLLVLGFRKINLHYQEVARELTLRGLPPSLKPVPTPRLIVPISGVHRGTIEAMRYARSISDQVTAVFVEIDPANTPKVLKEWETWGLDVPLKIVPSPYRSLIGPLLDFLNTTDQEINDGQLASVLLPEFVPVRWWHHLLHNQTATLLRMAILYNRRRIGAGRAIIDIPFYLRK